MKPICLLQKGHDRSTFDCGQPELNEYLQRYARQSQERGGSKTYVALDGKRFIGYYTLVVGEVEWTDCPEALRKGLGRYPVPVIVIARLAVDKAIHGKGVGMGLLKDAFLRVLQVADIVGVVAVIVDAKDAPVRDYYLGKNLGFQPMPGRALQLFLPTGQLRTSLLRCI